MKLGFLATGDAKGGIVVHSIRQGGLVLKKGSTVGDTEIAALKAAGIKAIMVARVEPGDVSEDTAAAELAAAVAGEGVHVTMTARGAEVLKAAADEIRKKNPGVTVTEIVGDITTPAGRADVLKACPEPDILINNAGGPPPNDFRDLDEQTWLQGLIPNLVAPVMLIKATVDGMAARRFGRIVNITSRSVKTPLYHLPLSNAAVYDWLEETL